MFGFYLELNGKGFWNRTVLSNVAFYQDIWLTVYSCRFSSKLFHTLKPPFHTFCGDILCHLVEPYYLCPCKIDNGICSFLRQTRMKKQLVISTSIDLVRIAPERIVYIASDGNYSTLVQTDGEVRMLTFQLGQIERMIADQLGSEGNNFIRIGKSLIINRSYIYYINVPKQKLTLSDVSSFNHTVAASKEALKQLKELIEKEVTL